MAKRTLGGDTGAAKTQGAAAARGRGRPSTYSEATVDYLVNQMIEHGRALVAICDDEGMPARATVYRWLGEHRAFAVRVDAAREAIADHAVWQADQVVKDTRPDTANADRIKLIHFHWKAAKMGPGRYGDRRTTELTGPKGGPVQLEQSPVVLDASSMSRDARDALRAILLAAKKTAEGKPVK